MKLTPLDPSYPRSLFHLDQPPELTLSGPLENHGRVIAIVGSRSAPHGALDFVHTVAYHLAKAGVVVVSGGAVGVDTKAHMGALRAGGTTFCVACSGRGRIFPEENEALFERIEASSTSRMIWPFADETPKDEHTPRYRNGVLVGLAEAVIVVQASLKSGSRNAMSWARYLGRRLLLVPSTPWDPTYAGSMLEIERGGVEPIWSIDHLFSKLGLAAPDVDDRDGRLSDIKPRRAPPRRLPRRQQSYSAPPLFPVEHDGWSEDEKRVFSILSYAPAQQDSIIERAGLPTSSTLTALLTLSLKDVVVEGPDGFFRRRTAV